MKLISLMALALVLTSGPSGNAEAKDEEMIALTGCVRGFAEGGYFFSDVVTPKGKIKNYLLVNNNDELKRYEGQRVRVVGSPAPFGWSVKFKTEDNRTLKAGDVFGVDTVEPLEPTCEAPVQVAQR
jgi:hypothetical protein